MNWLRCKQFNFIVKSNRQRGFYDTIYNDLKVSGLYAIA